MKTLIALVLFLTSSVTFAGSFGRYGVGVFNTSKHGFGNAKAFSVGYEDDWFGPFIHQYELGVLPDSSGSGRESSCFGNVSFGIEVNPGYLVLRSLWGLAAITNPDAMLGGWFNFNQDFLFGVRDNRGRLIGANYKHISNAGIYRPNFGRDYLEVHIEIPW